MDIGQIQKRISMIEQQSKEIRDAKEMLKEELENEESYREAIEELAEINAKRKRIREEIMSKSANQKLAIEIKENTEELKLLKEILSVELTTLHRENNTDEITDADGKTRKFVIAAKLLPLNSKSENRDSFGKYTAKEE